MYLVFVQNYTRIYIQILWLPRTKMNKCVIDDLELARETLLKLVLSK